MLTPGWKFSRRFSPAVLLAVTAALSAGQARASIPSSAERLAPGTEIPTTGWRLFGGISTGYGTLQGTHDLRSPGGTQTTLAAHLSYQVARWAGELGVGWSYLYFTGIDPGGRDVTYRVREGLLDVSPRYRFTERWQLGPVAYATFGTDTSFRPEIGSSEANYYLGARSVYELGIAGFPVQLWQQVAKDLTLGNRQVWVASIGIQVGLPFRLTLPTISLPRVVPVVASLPPLPEPQKELKIALDPQKIFFSTASSRVRPEVRAILKDVGAYLKDHPEGWEGIDIAGHADQRGKFSMNLRLSRKRADQVRRALLEGGADPERLSAEGFSYLKPLDPAMNPEAWSRNRRVEILFRNVEDARALREKLQPLTRGDK